MCTQDHTNESDEPPAERIRYIMLPPGVSGESLSLAVHLFIRLESRGDKACTLFYNDPDTGEETHTVHSHGIGCFEEDFKANPELLRVHRRHIINMDHMRSFNYKTQVISLKKNHRVPLGPNYKDDFLSQIYPL